MKYMYHLKGKYFALRFRYLFFVNKGLHKPDMPDNPWAKFMMKRGWSE